MGVQHTAAPPRLRGYEVERRLGGGAASDVWQARVPSSGALVALKRIPVGDPEQVRRAEAEAALLAALDHPNLVRLHALVPTGDALVLVLDLAAGGSLADLLAARGRLSPGEVITALAPVGAALEYLHGEGVVHGDVSAANVLFTGAGVALLADVGVARLTGDDADAEASPAYADPAVAAGYAPGSPSDVFMLGAVALHALTGAPPWSGVSAGEMLAQAAAGDLGDVAARLAAADVPPAMADVVVRALAVDPQRRGSAADFALELAHSGRPLAVELAAGSRTPGAQAPAPTQHVGPRPRPVIPRPVRHRRPSRRVIAAAVAALAGCATAGSVWMHRTSRTDEPARPSAVPRVQVETQPSAPVAPRAPAVLATLRGLDAIRTRAFATRDPRLLRRVYLPGPLLRADTATLAHVVAPGCRLVGARTRYAAARARPQGGRVIVLVQATLHPSVLMCAGRRAGHAPGTSATLLRIELTRSGAGYRIAAERRSGAGYRIAADRGES